MSTLFLLLLICFSLHACNARFVGLTDWETKNQIFNKDVDNLNLQRTTSMPTEMETPFSEERAQGQQYVVRKKGRSTRKISLLGATTMNQKDAEVFMEQEGGTKRASSGNMVIVSSQADLQQPSKIREGYKGQERSMLGSTANDSREAVQSEESDDISEDVVVMDYAQPHRKPPIHNEKP